MVILDTCAIIEALKPTPSFSAKTAKLMDAGAYILSISFAEIACKIKIGKIEMIDISVNEWLDSIELIWDENKDPADRIITAFAIKNELPIVTTDKKIETFYRKIIW